MRLEKTDQKKWWVSIEPNGSVSLFSRAVTEHELMESWNKLSVALAVFGFNEKMIAECTVDKLLHSPVERAEEYACDLIHQPMVRHVKRDEFPKRWRNN
jgi:hypothetical protein